MTDPDWLLWAREVQAIAQTGLTFCRDPYDRERYEQLGGLAARMFAARSGAEPDRIATLFANERGYATPKVDVRGAVFDPAGRLLMVREVSDGGRWTLPGGWADVMATPAENVVKEVREESGYQVRVVKLAACWDRTRQGHASGVFACTKLFFVCEPTGGAAATSLETSEVAWFARDDVPQDLSEARTLHRQILRMFDHHAHPRLPTDFD